MADLALARKVLETEAAAILALVARLDSKFERAVELLRCCRGRVILTGMGKSGIICQKIAATLTSTGTPALFLHPAEAIHGDIGVVQPDDVVVALSYSGETDEILRLLESIRRLGVKLIVISGAPESALAQAADVALDCSVTEEACPLNLAPTASTTAALAIGDALAMTLLVEKGFRQEDFASLHPGGRLGKRLMRIEQRDARRRALSHRPYRHADARRHLRDDEQGARHDLRGGRGADALIGIITDGDLRRHMARDVRHPPADSRRRHDARSGHGPADDAGRRSPDHHGRRARSPRSWSSRSPRNGSPASSTCTISVAK